MLLYKKKIVTSGGWTENLKEEKENTTPTKSNIIRETNKHRNHTYPIIWENPTMKL